MRPDGVNKNNECIKGDCNGLHLFKDNTHPLGKHQLSYNFRGTLVQCEDLLVYTFYESGEKVRSAAAYLRRTAPQATLIQKCHLNGEKYNK